jgi:hypothetical protein
VPGCLPEYEAVMTRCWVADPVDRPDWKWILEALLQLKDNLPYYQVRSIMMSFILVFFCFLFILFCFDYFLGALFIRVRRHVFFF